MRCAHSTAEWPTRGLIAIGEDGVGEHVAVAHGAVRVEQGPIDADAGDRRTRLHAADRLEELGLHARDVTVLVEVDAFAALVQPDANGFKIQSAREDEWLVRLPEMEVAWPAFEARVLRHVVAVRIAEEGEIHAKQRPHGGLVAGALRAVYTVLSSSRHADRFMDPRPRLGAAAIAAGSRALPARG
jgi:hypothetical protein